MKGRSKILFSAVASIGVLAVFSYKSTLDRFSCAGCGGFRYVTTRSVSGTRVSQFEGLELRPAVVSGDVNDWRRFPRHTSTPISTSVACQQYRFAYNRN